MTSANGKIVNIGFFPGFSLLMAVIGIVMMLIGQHLAQPDEPDWEQFVSVPEAELPRATPGRSSHRPDDRQVKLVKDIWL